MEIIYCSKPLKECSIAEVTVVDGKILVNNIPSSCTTSILNKIIHIGGSCLAWVQPRKKEDENGSTLIPMFFVSIHTHSEYSLLDGMNRISDLASHCVGSMALTDHGNMFGCLAFQKEMLKNGKKPILGCECYIGNEQKNYHIILLAKNQIGIKNLFWLTSYGYDNFYKKPRINEKVLFEHSEGIICTSACIGGEISQLLLSQKVDEAEQKALQYKNHFKDDFYIEIQKHHFKLEEDVMKKLLTLARKINIKIVAGIDSHFLSPDDKKYHDMLLCINDKKTLHNHHRTFNGDGYHILSQNEAWELFYEIPDALQNTLEICKKCNAFLQTGTYYNPVYPVPTEYSSDKEYLNHLIETGFQKRFKGTDAFCSEEYRSRLNYEKNIILEMGYASYFLIVWDYIQFAKNNGIAVGPGRGSAAGSLVAYCLEITELDPIVYDLLFERFLNPERVSMPDIDVDFQHDRRQEVINYTKSKYGKEQVCNIITFGTMAAKMILKDVARVMELQDLGCRLSALVPDTPGIKLKDVYQNIENFKQLVESNPDAQKIYLAALKMEGLSRNTSVHACGILIAPDRITNFLPTCLVGNKKDGYIRTSQVTMEEVEELGILKMDFLALKTMTVIQNTMQTIHSEYTHYLDIPLFDPYCYEYIATQSCDGIFQIESEGMQSFMSELYSDVPRRIRAIEAKYGQTGYSYGVAECSYKDEMTALGRELFDRMIAGVSLYRPGPKDYIPQYLQGMRNPDKIQYATPELIPILEPTYGVITFQEQVMRIVQVLAGFSMSQADIIRKAMGKKKEKILLEYREYFIYGSGSILDSHTGRLLNIVGCIGNGFSEKTAIEIWEKMKDFGKYAFNKSHGATYAVITLVTAWQKLYHPVEFMTSLLNVFINSDKFLGYLYSTKRMGIQIIPPDINKSNEYFTYNNNNIIFGLKGLKNLNTNISEIISERENNGIFKNEQDFAFRLSYLCNRKILESLVYSGAFDCFKGTRSAKISIIDKLLNHAKYKAKWSSCGQLSLFDICEELKDADSIKLPELEEFSDELLLSKEKEFVGYYISKHPLDEYQKEINQSGAYSVSKIKALIQTDQICTRYNMYGLISNIHTFATKSNKLMATFTVEDQTGNEMPVVIFPNEYESFGNILKEDEKIMFTANLNDEHNQLICKSLRKLEHVPQNIQKKCYINIDNQEAFQRIKKICSGYPGTSPVIIQCNKQLYQFEHTIDITSGLLLTLTETFGEKNIIIR